MSLTVSGRVVRGSFELDLDLVVEDGEVLGVLGPNGAGKSTLLRTVAGLLALGSGRLAVDDRVWDDALRPLPPEERSVGMVFQDYRLFPHLDVLDNVAFAGRSAGVRRSASRESARPWLSRLGIADLAGRKPAQLSGGQAQRVALARALARDPAVLLLDEPLAALDSRTKLDVRSELRGHLADYPGATLLVTHDPLDAMVLADRLLVLEGGRVVQAGAPAEVAARPATEYVARLVGLNLYAGRRDRDEVTLEGGGRLVVAGERVDGPVLLAVRPAAITLHVAEPEPSSVRNVWSGRVGQLALLGDRVRVEVSGAPPALVDVTPAAVADLGLVAGTEVWLTAKATEIDAYPDPHAPDAATGPCG